MTDMDKEKEKWLSDIGAIAFPEPVRWIYKLPEGQDKFYLTERYVEDTPLSELKERYERNRRMAEDTITAKKLLEQNRSTYYRLPERSAEEEKLWYEKLERVRTVYLCECGKFKHRVGANYCSKCGRKIEKDRENALAEQIEPLLERWCKENGQLILSRKEMGM